MTHPALEPRYPQLAKEPLLTGKLKTNAENRIFAKLIDAILGQVLVSAVAFFWPPAAYILPFLYWGQVDRIGRGQSPGKWLLGLHTIELLRGTKARFYNGIVRNFPFIVLSVCIGLQQAPVLAAFILLCLGIESYLIFSVRSGLRVGDILSYTRVFDYKDEHTKFIEQFLKDDDAI